MSRRGFKRVARGGLALVALTLTGCPRAPSAPDASAPATATATSTKTATRASSPHSGCRNSESSSAATRVPRAFAAAGTHGLDVSHYNGAVPWRSLTEGGLDYVFVKATEGASNVDPRFVEHWAAAKRCGLARGAYHFLHPDEDPHAQAEHFVAQLAADAGELPPVVDVERAARGTQRGCEDLVAHVRVFVQTAERALGRELMIYSGAAFWRAQLCDTRAFSSRPLWVARYSREAPEHFGGWRQWSFWQYTDHFASGGENFDLDRASAAGEALLRGERSAP